MDTEMDRRMDWNKWDNNPLAKKADKNCKC